MPSTLWVITTPFQEKFITNEDAISYYLKLVDFSIQPKLGNNNIFQLNLICYNNKKQFKKTIMIKTFVINVVLKLVGTKRNKKKSNEKKKRKKN